MPAEQLQFAFPSLDFPGRTTLTAEEVAERLGWDVKHVRDLITEGELPGINGKGKGVTRATYRVPIEAYRDFVTARITGPRQLDMLRQLPRETLQALVQELSAFLNGPA